MYHTLCKYHTMHIEGVFNPLIFVSAFLLHSVRSFGWLQPCLTCVSYPALGWVHTGGIQYVLIVEAGEGKRAVSWGPEMGLVFPPCWDIAFCLLLLGHLSHCTCHCLP